MLVRLSVLGTVYLYLLAVPGGEEGVARSSVVGNVEVSHLCFIPDGDGVCTAMCLFLGMAPRGGVGVK